MNIKRGCFLALLLMVSQGLIASESASCSSCKERNQELITVGTAGFALGLFLKPLTNELFLNLGGSSARAKFTALLGAVAIAGTIYWKQDSIKGISKKYDDKKAKPVNIDMKRKDNGADRDDKDSCSNEGSIDNYNEDDWEGESGDEGAEKDDEQE